MTDELLDLLVHDVWDALPEELREEFLTRRTAVDRMGGPPRQEWDGRRWEPLRPVIIGERAYRGLECSPPGCCTWPWTRAVAVPRRWANCTALLRFPHELPLMDPDRPLVAAELTRYRPSRPPDRAGCGPGFSSSTTAPGSAATR